MNKDRRKVAGVTARLCEAYGDNVPPRRVLFALKDSVTELIGMEERSLQKMEPYRDKPATAANYEVSQESIEELNLAVDAIIEGDLQEAAKHLSSVAEEKDKQ